MNIEIYDIEVFEHDWIVVFRNPEDGAEHTVIHNNNHQLREYIIKNNIFLGGFNNKWYDDWVVHAMLNGADNAIVKQLNDFIISGRNGWEFPFLQYKRKDFMSFDLRDDLAQNLSLKAIEGYMGQNIVESAIPWDLDRPLTPDELESTIQYCKTDVDNTVKLYHARKSYLESKKTVAKIKGMDEIEAMSLTNAKLTARFLDATKKPHDDEFDYFVPKELNIGKYQRVVDFFLDPLEYTLNGLREQLHQEQNARKIKTLTNKIKKLQASDRYDCDFKTDIAGVPHVYAWGGIHGAIPNFFIKADDQHKIVTIDVGSYYPSMMLEYEYISRNIPSLDGYADIYHMRMDAKHRGDKAVADALKLILNTCYGAMKNRYNELYDPRNASAICITGQLFLTDLIDKLEAIDGFELIQSNTDGLIIRFPIETEDAIVAVVSEWEQRTRMNMEYTVIHAIAQKDVNNYVMKSGEVYLYKDGQKIVSEPDKGKIKSKGGYVSLNGGGDFKNNSMVVLHKALVNYFMEDIPIEETIAKDNEVQDYQIIAKTGSTYQGTYHEVNGEQVDVQKVNRVYATKNDTYGTIYKTKANGRADKIASLPDQCIIDNEGQLTMDDVDKEFYLDLAKKRVNDYLGKKPKTKTEKKEVKTMVAAKQETTLNIYQKINRIRMDWLEANVQKSGINRFAEYKYFELSDIVPVIMPLCEKYGLITLFDFDEETAYMKVIDTNLGENNFGAAIVTFRSPMRKLAVKGMNEIQALGGVETYQRRYLYMMFLDIVEQDAFDATNGKPEDDEPKAATKTTTKTTTKSEPAKKSNRPASATERAETKKDLINEDGAASAIQVKSIKGGLKKLRDKNESYEPYIKEIVAKIKAGLSKKDAEDVLIEIGKKIEE